MQDFNTHGGFFSPQGYLRIDEGGSHEQNPNGGVQIGMDENGIPNMLEEGEPVYKDFVFSDNIHATKEALKQNNLPEKYAGKLYSEIADDYVDEAEKRPLDPISNNGLNAMLIRLASAQEEQKQLAEQKEVEDELSSLSPEELAELEAMLGQAEGEGEPVMPASPTMPVEVAPEQTGGQPMMMARGGLLRTFPDGGSMTPEEFYRINGYWPEGYEKSVKEINPDWFNVDLTEFDKNSAYDENATLGHSITKIGAPSRSLAAYVVNPTKETIVSKPEPETETDDIPTYPTWPMYAGTIGSGLLALNAAVQEPDKYTLRDAIPFTPAGRINLSPVVYNPIDENMIAGQIASQNAATIRALRNAGVSPSTTAAIIAADNNATANLGTGFIQAWDANNQRRNAVIAANNEAEATRANFDYTIDSARANALTRAQQQNIQNSLMLQRLNNQAEQDKYNAVSQNLDNALAGLSGIGRTNFAMNQVNSNRALYDYVNEKGEANYKGRKRSCGGFIKPYRRK